jgi:Uma2 family endonuclease
MATVASSVPPLVAGDKLTRDEFLRRFEADPSLTRAELIGGIVYMPSPLSIDQGEMDSPLRGMFWLYTTYTPGTKAGHNATALMQSDAPQPDDYLRILPEYGGQCLVKGKYLKGAPELIGEICLSSTAYDLHQKLELYEAAGVREYVAVLLYEREVRWHRRVGKRFKLLKPGDDGILRSLVFPGLWLDPEALLAEDLAPGRAVLQQGLTTQEHADFVKRLAAKRK